MARFLLLLASLGLLPSTFYVGQNRPPRPPVIDMQPTSGCIRAPRQWTRSTCVTGSSRRMPPLCVSGLSSTRWRIATCPRRARTLTGRPGGHPLPSGLKEKRSARFRFDRQADRLRRRDAGDALAASATKPSPIDPSLIKQVPFEAK